MRATMVMGLLLITNACGPGLAPLPVHDLESARLRGKAATATKEDVGRWLLFELLAPGGNVEQAARARKALSASKPHGLLSSLATAMDADGRGRFIDAGHGYLRVLEWARKTKLPEGEITAWFAARRLNTLRVALGPIGEQLRSGIAKVIDAPGYVGWRARAELLALWLSDELSRVTSRTRTQTLEALATKSGCLKEVSFAGPFGRGEAADRLVHFEAERSGPWPARFDAVRGVRPVHHAATRVGCTVKARGESRPGIYYAQSFVDLPKAQTVIVVAHGAYALFVDDRQVLDRSPSRWGVWPRFGVRLRLGAGRHRLLARLVKPQTAFRVLLEDGSPAPVTATGRDEGLYASTGPKVLSDPNPLALVMRLSGVEGDKGWPRAPKTAASLSVAGRFMAAHLAHVDGQDDLASVIIEPLVKDLDAATPLAMTKQALFVMGDPVLPPSAARDLARDLRQRAFKRDPGLWQPALATALDKTSRGGKKQSAQQLEALALRFGQVPAVHRELIAFYRKRGWQAELVDALNKASQAFPSDVSLLTMVYRQQMERGQFEQADALAKRIETLDPDHELRLESALRRRDYDAAIAHLKGLAEKRDDKRAIAARIEGLLVRAGRAAVSMDKLERALAQDPMDESARLAIADARLAAGRSGALTEALVDAIDSGAPSRRLNTAIELVEGMTDLEPYRRDGLAIIASSKNMVMKGTAARVLDYGAVWAEADGRSRMLEHEIIRIQSREAIAEHAEQRLAGGWILNLRTIKADGRIFEPEIVSGKPTVTMPHLEVGDYIETESIWELSGPDGEGGRRFKAPRWYFREKNVSYHLSEFVVVSPSTRTLQIETTGEVPAPVVDERAGLETRRWRVTRSVALAAEPLSAPIREFLPSVQVGWGIQIDDQLRRWKREQALAPPKDPRMRRVASRIAGKGEQQEKARRIYRWVLDNVQSGKEGYGPRIVTGRAGSRVKAFVYLCELAGIDARIGLIKNRLQPPAKGPFSRAQSFSVPAVRVRTKKATTWMLVGDAFAPYGYLPSALRGQQAVLLQSKAAHTSTEPRSIEREQTNRQGLDDGITHVGTVDLQPDGSARFELKQTYSGRFAILLRNVLSKVPASRRKEVVETRLLGSSLPGVRVEGLQVGRLDRFDEPVVLDLTLFAPNFARGQSRAEGKPGGAAEGPSDLVVAPPFLARLDDLVRLPQRETPLYLSNRMATHTRIELAVRLPKGLKLGGVLQSATIEAPRVRVSVQDDYRKGVLTLRRDLDVTAGRIQPEDYPAFRQDVRRADAALRQTMLLRATR